MHPFQMLSVRDLSPALEIDCLFGVNLIVLVWPMSAANHPIFPLLVFFGVLHLENLVFRRQMFFHGPSALTLRELRSVECQRQLEYSVRLLSERVPSRLCLLEIPYPPTQLRLYREGLYDHLLPPLALYVAVEVVLLLVEV